MRETDTCQPKGLSLAAGRGGERGGPGHHTGFPFLEGDRHIHVSLRAFFQQQGEGGSRASYRVSFHVGDRHISASGLSASSGREMRRGRVQGIIQGFLFMWETDTCQPQGFLPAGGGGFAVVVVEGLGVVGGSRTLYRAWAIKPETYGH
jgi:hypothetical protein